jgi:hypothetical protein
MATMSDSVEIRPYAGQSRDDLAPLFSKYSFGRYCSDRSLDLQASRRFELNQLYSYLQQSPTTSWLAIQGGVVVGVIGLRKSKWDTDFWGVNYANIDYLMTQGANVGNSKVIIEKLTQTMDEWSKQERLDFISARVDVFDLPTAHVLENHDFKYIETTITNSFDLKRLDPTPSEDYVIRLARPEEMDLLIEMSKDGFLTHRFYADTRFPKQKVDEMYRLWVQNSFVNHSIWTTVVLEKEHQVRGFMTYRVEDLTSYFGMNFVKWRMAALEKNERGKGHGVDLFVGAMKYVHGQAGVVDSGITIRNIHSFNLHTKLNFKLICSSITFHKWFS